MLSRAAVCLLWLLHFLPQRPLALLGRGLGRLLHRLARQRRRVVATNLALCFPELDAASRARLAQRHFALFGQSLVERSLFWWAPQQRLEKLIEVRGAEKVHRLRAAGRPVLLLAPHFLGLDAGGLAVTMRFDIVSIYAEQSDPLFGRLILAGRRRFGDQLLLARADGPRATVKAMKSGRPFYYLPDMNFRTRDAVFAPFFGVPAWTITGLSRLSRLAGAAVVPCVSRMKDDASGYLVEFGDPWDDFPSADPLADTQRMNRWLEEVVRSMPAQYYWVHRRFKTRPAGETSPYRCAGPDALSRWRQENAPRWDNANQDQPPAAAPPF